MINTFDMQRAMHDDGEGQLSEKSLLVTRRRIFYQIKQQDTRQRPSNYLSSVLVTLGRFSSL